MEQSVTIRYWTLSVIAMEMQYLIALELIIIPPQTRISRITPIAAMMDWVIYAVEILKTSDSFVVAEVALMLQLVMISMGVFMLIALVTAVDQPPTTTAVTADTAINTMTAEPGMDAVTADATQ
jgi:hypothetical protein